MCVSGHVGVALDNIILVWLHQYNLPSDPCTLSSVLMSNNCASSWSHDPSS